MWWLLPTLALAGRRTETPPPAVPAAVDPGCPSGSAPAGAVPPAGTAVWCERPVPGRTVREGPTFLFSAGGAIRARGAYADDREHGVWTWYFPDGTVESTGAMVLGEKFGEWATYYPNGQLASRGSYLDDQRHGPWELWSEDGARVERGDYVRGAPIGLWIESGFGRPLREKAYRDGRLITVRDL